MSEENEEHNEKDNKNCIQNNILLYHTKCIKYIYLKNTY